MKSMSSAVFWAQPLLQPWCWCRAQAIGTKMEGTDGLRAVLPRAGIRAERRIRGDPSDPLSSFNVIIPRDDGIHCPSPSQGSPALGLLRSQRPTQLTGVCWKVPHRSTHIPSHHPSFRTSPAPQTVSALGGWFCSQDFGSQFLHASPSTEQQQPSSEPLHRTSFPKPKSCISPSKAAAPKPSELQQGGTAAAPRCHFLTQFQFPLSTQRLTFRLH